MDGIKSREEFERNFFLLKESQINVSSDVKRITNSIARIRYLPNKRIDFLTVDEGARCLANTTMFTLDNELIKELEKKEVK